MLGGLVAAVGIVALLTLTHLQARPSGSGQAPAGAPPGEAPLRDVPSEDAQSAIRAATQTAPELTPSRRTPIVEAARRVIPSVVSVNVIRRQRVAPSSPFEEFFVPFGHEREVAGLGSGFAIAPGGYVLTNAHVVQGATEIVVTAPSGTDLPAELIGTDELSDLALLRVDEEIPVPELGDSDGLVVGEPAIAIGNPFGYLLSNAEATVTSGVISGVGRHILPAAFSGRTDPDGTVYADMIQTDASINPGNSGGPLVNADGEVIGVNSAIFSMSGGFQGLGFAIPIDRARRTADQLRSLGRVRRPWVGIEVRPADRGPAGRPRGAAVARVVPGSPADRAELSAGSEIVEIAGRAVKSPLDWDAHLLAVVPGDTVSVRVRDERGRERDVRLPIEDLPSVRAARIEALSGLALVTLTPAIRSERGLRSRAGALVVDASDEIARVSGLRPGDLIVQINRWPIESAEDVARIVEYLAGQSAVRVYYERGRAIWSTIFRIEQA